MRIVVSDTSCMIDLRKGGLLEAMLQLPYSFVMPDTLFENEWLGLSADEKRALLNLGLEVHTLPGPLVQRAAQYFNSNPPHPVSWVPPNTSLGCHGPPSRHT